MACNILDIQARTTVHRAAAVCIPDLVNQRPRFNKCVLKLQPPAIAPASLALQQQQAAVCHSRRHTRPSAAASSYLGAGDGSFRGRDAILNMIKSLQEFVEAQYLPIALLSALVIGATNPAPGLAAAKLQIPAVATFGIFLCQGLQLRKKEAMKALTAKAEIAYGLLSILLLTPLLGMLVAQLPLHPRPLALGLGVVCTVPTALACGVAFVQQLGGNVSLALLLTVVSNIAGIFTMPFILPHVVAAANLTPAAAAAGGSAAAAASGPMMDPIALMIQLCQTILLPTFIGAAIRGFIPGGWQFIDKHKKTLSYMNAAFLASVPWVQVSKTATSKMSVDVSGVLLTAAAAVAVHVFLLAANTLAVRLLGLGGNDPVKNCKLRRGLIIVGSVKTLPVAVTVLSKLGPILGEAVVGIAMLPVVFYQMTQIIWESVMVARWLAADKVDSEMSAGL